LEELVGEKRAPGKAVTDTDRQAVTALAGLAAQPDLSLSTAIDQFYSLTRDRRRLKSTDQIRRWKAPRLKAVNNLIKLVGDKRVADLTRADALALRAFWVDRVTDEGYTPNSANKDIGHLAQLVGTLNDALELGLPSIFEKLRLNDGKRNRRAAFTIQQVKGLLAPGALDGLNEEARGIVHVMVETGMRPIEICWLDADHIHLKHEVPHVRVRPQEHELKTPYSERDIPLVGISLEALKKAPAGFPKYRDKSATLSATVNKYLVEHKLLPTEKHSLYSIRHTFKDRLVAADIQDRLQDELMGHKSPRPVYGEGPSLKQKQDWLIKISIT
ncbi:MAG: tyrosine-type recombinase/integrase, partial [Rhizobiales bacterium]|nr:tyrosine-type recombinase/integrase [Hyphomicrobiales bacterium]